ncbi:MAG: GFA family protein [Pseudomonadales bacterium]
MNHESLTGSCLCGAVRYAISGGFAFLGNCHCSICRKANGAAFATWGILDPKQFQWTQGEDQVRWYASSASTRRAFCGNCGAALAAAHDWGVSEVVVATVDGDPGARPREHIFVGSKAVWHHITDDLPQHETWPPDLAEPKS